MPRVVGLTGGIATGKSTVSSLWKSKGATIIDADAIARQVVQPGRPAYHLIRRHFGRAVINADGTLNRSALANIIFSNAGQRTALNRRIHPFIMISMVTQLVIATLARWRSVVVLDAPLLFESGTLVPFCSRIVVVTASRQLQISRLLARDAGNVLTESDACKRIDSQMPLDSKVERAHFVIDNSGAMESLSEQAMNVFDQVQPSLKAELAFRAIVCVAGVKIISFFVSWVKVIL